MYDIVLLVLLLMLVIVICALVWAGFLAKSKNTRAAALVEHLSTFLLGAFFGHKTSIGMNLACLLSFLSQDFMVKDLTLQSCNIEVPDLGGFSECIKTHPSCNARIDRI